ncbi:MAG TPA: hypothetical protein V6D18_00635 [Thermosynechococcaceae cyanobacterium]
MKLQAVTAQGQPLKDAQIHVQILTPPPTPWFTTDFPMTEGTTLLDLAGDAPTGALLLQQTFPIRGIYRILVDVTPIMVNTFAPFQQTLNLTVSENPLKFRYLILLVAVLLLVGLVGGWVIGGQQVAQVGEIAPQSVRLLLSGTIGVAIVALLVVNISAELAKSHGTHSHDHAPLSESRDLSVVRSQGLEASLLGDRQATVGQVASLVVQVRDAQTQKPVSSVRAKITVSQVENNWLAFVHEGTTSAMGQLQWKQQFFDGAPHKIEVEIAPQPNGVRSFQPFVVAREVEVEGAAPPIWIRLTTLAYFTGIVVVGLLAGLGIQRHRSRQQTLTSSHS